jgi:tRNA A-37 threonylcarbamoyl transferase component Bud32
MVRRTRRILRKKGGAVPCVKKSIRIGTRSGVTADIKQECLMKAEKIHYGQELGCGEYGCAYAIMERGDQVVKITTFAAGITEDKWYEEACLGSHLGLLGIGPNVYNFFVCNGTGFILMARLTDATKFYINKKGGPTLVTIRDEGEDHISLMPVKMQIGFVQKLYDMIEAGFIHMDNHIGNIGFTGKEPILFDFGFTQERAWEDDDDKAQALAFSIFQILEHCPLDEVEDTTLFKIATSILNGTYTWGDDFADLEGMNLEELEETYPQGTKLAQFKKKGASFGSNKDIYIGNMCYASIITMDREDRYDSPLYGAIYAIRRGEAY